MSGLAQGNHSVGSGERIGVVERNLNLAWAAFAMHQLHRQALAHQGIDQVIDCGAQRVER